MDSIGPARKHVAGVGYQTNPHVVSGLRVIRNEFQCTLFLGLRVGLGLDVRNRRGVGLGLGLGLGMAPNVHRIRDI